MGENRVPLIHGISAGENQPLEFWVPDFQTNPNAFVDFMCIKHSSTAWLACKCLGGRRVCSCPCSTAWDAYHLHLSDKGRNGGSGVNDWEYRNNKPVHLGRWSISIANSVESIESLVYMVAIALCLTTSAILFLLFGPARRKCLRHRNEYRKNHIQSLFHFPFLTRNSCVQCNWDATSIPNPDAREVTPSGAIESEIPRVQISNRHRGSALRVLSEVKGIPLFARYLRAFW